MHSQMKPSFSMAVLLLLLISEAQGIRLEKGGRLKTAAVFAVKDGGNGLEMMKRRAPNKALRKPYSHWLPGIQEDYHGPRSHKPRHH